MEPFKIRRQRIHFEQSGARLAAKRKASQKTRVPRKEDQMKRADERRSRYNKLRAARRLLKNAKEAAAKKKKDDKRDRIRQRILRRIQQEKQSRSTSTR